MIYKIILFSVGKDTDFSPNRKTMRRFYLP